MGGFVYMSYKSKLNKSTVSAAVYNIVSTQIFLLS